VGFKKYGIALSNCAGKPGRDVLIQDVHMAAAGDADAALAFALIDKITPKLNQYIAVRGCHSRELQKSRSCWTPMQKCLTT